MLNASSAGKYVGEEGDLEYEKEIKTLKYTSTRRLKLFIILVQMIRLEQTKASLRLCEHFIFNQVHTVKELLRDLIALGSDKVAMAIQKCQAPDIETKKEDVKRPFLPDMINNVERKLLS